MPVFASGAPCGCCPWFWAADDPSVGMGLELTSGGSFAAENDSNKSFKAESESLPTPKKITPERGTPKPRVDKAQRKTHLSMVFMKKPAPRESVSIVVAFAAAFPAIYYLSTYPSLDWLPSYELILEGLSTVIIP